jgi:hypothetical protein
MQGMEMEFGGYGVPMADKEAALRYRRMDRLALIGT